jgi:hypothetical protein
LSSSLFSSATGDVFDSVASSLKGGMNLASMNTHYASTASAASSFDGSCLCPSGSKWDGKAVYVEENGISASCGAMGGILTSLLGNSMNGGTEHETSTSPCNDVKRFMDMHKDHPDPKVTEEIASAEGKCCAGPVPTGAIVGGVLGGCAIALVGIGLVVRKKKAQRSDYAEMPK